MFAIRLLRRKLIALRTFAVSTDKEILSSTIILFLYKQSSKNTRLIFAENFKTN